MNLQIKSPRITLDHATDELIKRKFERLSQKYHRIEHCDVVLYKESSDIKKNHIVEVKVMIPKHELFASDRSENFGKAIDEVVDSLDHQLSRHKEYAGH